MNRLNLVLAAAVTVVMDVAVCRTATVNAQPPANRMAVSADFGPAVPTGDLAADFDKGGANASTGIRGGLSVERMIGGSFGISIGVRYLAFSIDTEHSPHFFLGSPRDVTYKIPAFDLSGRYLFSAESATRPFVTGGVMLAKPKVTGEIANGDRATAALDWTLGFHGGGGILHTINQTTAVFAVVEYNHLATDGTSYKVTANGEPLAFFGDKATLNSQWVSVRGGVTIFWGAF